MGARVIRDDEFKHAKVQMRLHGLSKKDIDNVENVLHGAMNEAHQHKGVDERELKSSLDYLKKKKLLDEKKLKEAESALRKRL